jgi:hypothetical protein
MNTEKVIPIKKQYITRKGNFDSGHRVMNERMKCFNIHGHTYLYELEFEFNEMEEIGYAIDFKEIKRVAEGTRFRVYVLVALPTGDANILRKAKEAAKERQVAASRQDQAFKELDNQ